MINILFSGNKKVFDGALSELISITNKTKEPVNCIILTMDLTRLNKEFIQITDNQIVFLNKVVKSKNEKNQVKKIDVTKLYEKEFGKGKNESAYCTPYTLLRLFADLISDIPDKLLYLDIDMLAQKDISTLYNIDISNYEYAAVKEKYGSKIIKHDYINAGMLLLNMKKIRETKLLEKARDMLKERKLLFADQDAIYWNTISKLLLPRIYNEQRKFNCEDTVICHFAKRLWFKPYPHIENIKQWQVEKVHDIYKCHAFDKDLNEYIEWRETFNESY